MTIYIANAPCSWGVDDPKNPYLPPYEKVLKEAAQAGYKSIELGPWSYLPTDPTRLTSQLNQYGLSLVAGTLFDDLVSEANFPAMLELTHNICRHLAKVPTAANVHTAHFQAPYLVIIDFGHPGRARLAGQYHQAERLSDDDWQRMMRHITEISRIAQEQYGVRPVIHPHAGGCIEFADEIERLVQDIPHSVAGLCLDTGHLYYSAMDPVAWLDRYFERLDYIHFKDVNEAVFRDVIARRLDFFSACAEGVMCPIGKGAIDYPAVRVLLAERHYQGWVTIEQERDPRDAGGSLHDVTESLRYLKSVGF
ncbi:TIM barrel protein [Erwinia piriflorinigrans]|uniref:Inosose dehydratase n=1 Tax=Erwinia piriflorinigrans CFBP 5888 TaxID=1161919 RepID=V5ZD79_9GAMM|nr:TIM barrel protein [Erwinia piriflorinigrans]CCG89037.1 inosose dehydratase [Erwinia piriflorinigrans CFBP 5888]